MRKAIVQFLWEIIIIWSRSYVMNIDEVRILIANADIDKSGDLNIDEYWWIYMIFNNNEVFFC